MIEPTDQDIAEALNIAGTRLTVNAVRNWHETDGPAGLYFQHARTIAKLRIATEALTLVRDMPGEINPSNYNHDDACELNARFCEAGSIAADAITQIKDTTHAQ